MTTEQRRIPNFLVVLIGVMVLFLIVSAATNILANLGYRPGMNAGATLVVIMSDSAIGWRKEVITRYDDGMTCGNVLKAVMNPEFLREERATGLTISAECIGAAR